MFARTPMYIIVSIPHQNNVFVGLCYPASPLGPAASFCVDLTTGKTSVLPGNTVDVMWTNKPTSDGGRCSLRGVLKITPPKWAQSVSYHMTVKNSTVHSFNIGDPLTNNAWGNNKTQINFLYVQLLIHTLM